MEKTDVYIGILNCPICGKNHDFIVDKLGYEGLEFVGDYEDDPENYEKSDMLVLYLVPKTVGDLTETYSVYRHIK